jgi:hypothetical protein
MYVASNQLRLRGGTSGLAVYNTSGNEIFAASDSGVSYTFTGQSGSTNSYLKLVNTANSGKTWRVGVSGGTGGAVTSFDVYNETDTIMGMSITSAGVAKFQQGISLGGNETLSTYDEGTFTPVVKLGSNTQTGSPTGDYTRIGRAVHFTIVTGSLTKVGTGNLTIESLPFTAMARNFSLSIWADGVSSNGRSLTAYVGSASSTITFQGTSIGADGAAVGTISNGNCGATFQLIVAGTYFV